MSIVAPQGTDGIEIKIPIVGTGGEKRESMLSDGLGASKKVESFGEREKMSRRNFLGFTAGAIATVLLADYKGNNKGTLKNERNEEQDRPFSLLKSGNGFETYEGPNGSKVTIIYTNHDDEFDVNRIPDGVTGLILDRGGSNHQSGLATFLKSDNAPPHLKTISSYLKKTGTPCHLMAPAALGAGTDEYGSKFRTPQMIDYAVCGTQAAIGSLLVKDSYTKARGVRNFRMNDEIPSSDARSNIQQLIGVGGKQIIPDAGSATAEDLGKPYCKGVLGAYLAMPAIAAIIRAIDMSIDGKGRQQSLALLRVHLKTNPHILLLMNQFIDVVLTAKMRLYLLNQTRESPENPGHFACIYGGSHAVMGDALKSELSELINDLKDFRIKKLVQMYKGADALSLVSSNSIKYKYQQGIKQKNLFRGDDCIYPDIFKMLPKKQQQELLHCYPVLHDESCNVVSYKPVIPGDNSRIVASAP